MRSICLLLLLGIPAVAPGQATTPAAEASPIPAAGSFFALSVADLDSSTRWYSEKFGLRVTMRMPATNGASVAVLEGSGLIVELIQHDDAMPLSTAAPTLKGGDLFVHGVFKAGVIVDDFDGTIATLRARGVEIAFGPFPPRPNQRANAIVRDNAGNLIQIIGK